MEQLLQCLLFLLDNTHWTLSFSPNLLKQSLLLYINCLHIFNTAATNSGVTEEIKKLAIRCISGTLPISSSKQQQYNNNNNNNNNNVLKVDRNDIFLLPVIQNDTFHYVLAQCISELLEVIHNDYDTQLRLIAMGTLSQLLFENIVQSDKLALFLPGIVSILCKVIWQKQEKENHHIISYALGLLDDIICTVMEDKYNKEFINTVESLHDLKSIWKNTTISKQQQNDHQSMNTLFNNNSNDDDENIEKSESEKSLPKTIRTLEWYNKTKSSLVNLLKSVMSVCNHPNWNVRLAFVDFSFHLLFNCSGSLDNCVLLCIDTLVQLIDDHYETVSAQCRNKIKILTGTASYSTLMTPYLKEGLYKSLIDLPRYIISGSEADKLRAMHRITGYIYFLQKDAKTVLDTTLNKISDGWMAALEIDHQHLNIFEEKSAGKYIELEKEDNTNDNNNGDDSTDCYKKQLPNKLINFPKLKFKYLITDITSTQLVYMLNIIGRYASLQQWVFHFMAYVRVQEDYMEYQNAADQLLPQAAFIIHSLLSGAIVATSLENDIDYMDHWINEDSVDDEDEYDRDNKWNNIENLENIAQQVLMDMKDTLTLATVFRSLPTKQKPTTNIIHNQKSITDMEGNKITTLCLCLQIISLVTTIVGKKRMQSNLITLLYPVLTHLGSNNIILHSYALTTLDNIAITCGSQNGRQLAINNIDYIINSVSQFISMLISHPQAPLVLKALIHVGGDATLQYLQDSIEEVFDALDRYHLHEWLCRQLCDVLIEVVKTAAITSSSALLIESKMEKEEKSDTDNSIKEQDSLELSNTITSFIQQLTELKSLTETTDDIEIPKTTEDIGKFFLEQRQSGKTDKNILELMDQVENDDSLENDTSNETEQKEKEEKLPPLTQNQQLTYDIMNKSQHFLTSPSDQLRSQMLQLLTNGLQVLSTRPDKVNPLIHQLWHLIIHRLDDKTHYVAFHASELIKMMSKTNGDFISQRFEDDVWPRFKRFLKQGQQHMTTSSTMYSIYSYPHRVQYCALETLITASQYITFKQNTIIDIINASTWLLSKKMHSSLQDLAIQLFLTLYQQHPDTIWLHVFTLLKNPTLEPPIQTNDNNQLDPFTVFNWMKLHNRDYYLNAEKIMIQLL
ncbi:unnamed protein product [Cunninghamella echinulata]